MGKIKTGIKMKVNPEQSRKVQEICFENDIGWVGTNGVVQLTNKPFLFIDETISVMGEDEVEDFLEEENEEVSAELFIRTNGTCVESEVIPTEATLSKESQPKTLSEYLKENNAYESFIENCVEEFLNDINWYNKIKIKPKEDSIISLGNTFTWYTTEEGFFYWLDLSCNKPENFVYDMDEIVFAEVDKRIAEQKTQSEFISTEKFDQMFEQKATTKYMVFVEGRSNPKKVHDSYDSAEKEAKRLSAKEIGCNVIILSVIKTFESKVIVEEI